MSDAGHEHVEHVEHVERETWLDAAPGDVWTWLADPDALSRWLGGSFHVEPRPGAVGRWHGPAGDTRDIVVDRVEDGSELEWRWAPLDGDGPTTRVTISVEGVEPDGGCRVRVVERPVAAAPVSGLWSAITMPTGTVRSTTSGRVEPPVLAAA